ncbi:heavy metal translocating P-type ATPase [Thioclava sp.]|uniref:heavy metal translocating P-type ATPase n=1 Tax=Thioclava sp. TaxID=1933450 RepID=UPI003AA837B5
MAEATDFDPTTFDGVNRAVVGVDGLWCPSCAAAVGRAITAVPGVTHAQVSFLSASVAMAWAPGTDLHRVARQVSAMGYRLTSPTNTDEMEARISREMTRVAMRLAVAVAFGMWTMVFSILLYINPEGIAEGSVGRALSLAAGAAALPVIAFAGAPILLAGWRTARAGVPGMDSLVGLGVIGAVAASSWSLATGGTHVWFDTSVMLITLLTLGRLIEMGTLRKSSRSIAALHSALPESARQVHADGSEQDVLAEDIPVGARIRVGAGQRVPLDGRILRGKSRLDTSVMTGEAAPCHFAEGAEILAGFVNLSRVIEITVTAPMGQRRIDLIGADIASSLHDRPEVDRLADRLARVIVPLAVVLASATLGGSLLAGLSGEEAGLRALSVLIIACPCAVALAAPVTHLAATGAAARQGIHFRTQGAAERFGAARRILFDKTGTLTMGRPQVGRVRTRAGLDHARALALAAAAEHGIVHPVAEALRRAGGDTLTATTSERSDDGVTAEIDGYDVLIGNRAFVTFRGISPPDTDGDAALTEVLMAIDGTWAATFLLGDALRPDAAETIAQLRAAGIAPGMASGDGHAVCAQVGAAVGLQPCEIHAACTPEDKAALVAGSPDPTVFVGDGVNDLLAIVRAETGIAATDASAATIALADVVIARGGVVAVGDALAISRRARRVLRQNLAFSVFYNASALGLAVFGAVPPVAAAAAMTASSLMVIANAARLHGMPVKAHPANAHAPA